jgi:anaerobic magnesium-protoporphyrin IX monomethyl ester cyclase
MVDIVLISTPVMETRVPAPAIYYLKGALNPHGFTSRCFDLVRDSEEYFGKEDSKKVNSFLLADWHSGIHADPQDKEIYNLLLDYYRDYVLEKIAPLQPEYIGVSVFSQNSQKSSSILCKSLREVLPDSKIVLGGTGLGVTMGGKKDYGDTMLEQNLADYFIDGEGELALVELLKGNLDYPGINSTTYNQIDDLDSIPFPDYSDYHTDYGRIQKITLTGSRGCVRRCSFCDIGAFWKKFRYRSGKNIAEELIRNKKLYGSRTHFFSDSLINGSMKAFRELCEVMAEYHENNPEPEAAIRWGGQFIIRSERQSPAEDYKLMKKAGMRWASIGIESASENVRNHMDKQFSNKDMYFSIDELLKNNINCTLMFIVGYPTETQEDYEENIKFLKYYADRNSSVIDPDGPNGSVADINLGQTLGILPDSPLHDMPVHNKDMMFWKSTVVEDLTFDIRVKRRKELSVIANDLGYNVRWDEKQLHFLEKKLESYYKDIA